MTRSHKILWRLASSSRPSTTICRICLSHLRQIRCASAAASPVETIPVETDPSAQAPPALTASQSQSQAYKIKTSVLLSRAPQITRDLTPFEKAYFLYQRRLNERLALPFSRYFYYQKDTPGDVDWKRKVKDRLTPARDIGVYAAYGKEGWNDELLVGDRTSEPEEQVERLIRDAEVEVKNRGEAGEGVRREKMERPMPRVTEADQVGDLKSLNRLLQRTLYLVVSMHGEGREKRTWKFPRRGLEGKESLHTAAERILVQAGGVNMNTWVVGNMPIGHQVYNYAQPIVDKENRSELRGEKMFFMKARIMAGQASLENNQVGVQDFRWLAKEEIEKAFHPREYAGVRNLLAER